MIVIGRRQLAQLPIVIVPIIVHLDRAAGVRVVARLQGRTATLQPFGRFRQHVLEAVDALGQMLHVILQRGAVVLACDQQILQRFPRVNAALETAIHAAPELDVLRCQVRLYRFIHLRPVQRVNVLVQMVRHVAPQGEGFLRQPQIQPVLLAVAHERAVLAGHDVIVQDQQKALIELERVVALLHQLPGALEQLSKHGRDLLRVVLNVATAIAELVAERKPILFDQSLEGRRMEEVFRFQQETLLPIMVIYLKSFDSSVVWIQHQCSKRAYLSRTVPTI